MTANNRTTSKSYFDHTVGMIAAIVSFNAEHVPTRGDAQTLKSYPLRSALSLVLCGTGLSRSFLCITTKVSKQIWFTLAASQACHFHRPWWEFVNDRDFLWSTAPFARHFSGRRKFSRRSCRESVDLATFGLRVRRLLSRDSPVIIVWLFRSIRARLTFCGYPHVSMSSLSM